LFLSIPFELRLPGMSEEVITIMIFFSIFILMAGNMLNSRRNISPEKGSPEQGNDQADKSGSLETDSLEI